jgi:hypothetical protein
MSDDKFENGVSYYDITCKIEDFLDRHVNLDTKQEKEENLRQMLLYTMDYPEYLNHYNHLRETILENIQTNYLEVGGDPEFLTVCEEWVEMFGDA